MPTLGQLIDVRSKLSLPDAVAIVRAIAVQVVELHRAGQVHGKICYESITLDDALRPRLSDPGAVAVIGTTEHKTGTAVHELHVSTAGKRQRVPARVIARLCNAMMPDEAGAESPATGSLQRGTREMDIDSRRADVLGLGQLLCQMLTGSSADAYLRSPRVKGRVALGLQPLLDRVLGDTFSEPGQGPQPLDATGFIEALDRAAPGASAPLEVVDATPSCVSGLQLGNAGPAQSGTQQLDATPPDASLPFQKLGHYQIVSRLGHGGMGEVYLGYERGLDRQVAIKVLPAKFAHDPDLVRRFHAEAMAAAKLVHPNIIQIYYIGDDQGHTFFAMQYVEGMSLAQLLSRGRRLSLEESLAICDEVLAGMAAAHKVGLVHRDVKPSNILLDKVHRRALLADFGLVKSLQESEQSHTSTGMILGTADYIAPEQGLGNPIDCRCDLYSLGVVMYQMLCGRLPFIARESTAVIFQHVYVAPPALSELAPHVPPALAAIVEKLLAKSPDDRYQNADDVLVDLRAFRASGAGSDISTASEASRKAALDGGQPWALPAEKIDTSPIANRQTAAHQPTHPAATAVGPDPGRRRILLALTTAAGLPAIAGVFWFALKNRPRGVDDAVDGGPGRSRDDSHPAEIRQFRGHSSEVNCFALTPDESLLIVGDRTNKLTVWDFKMAEQRTSFRAHSGPIRRLIITADGKFAVTASTDQTLKLWNVKNWKQATQFNGHTDAVTSVVQVPGRDEIVSSSFDGRLRRWALGKGTPLAWYGDKPLTESTANDAPEPDPQKLERHVSWVRDLVIQIRGDQIISAGNDRVILIWDLESAQVVDRLIEHRGPVMCLAVSSDGSRLLSGGYDKTVCLWDLNTRQLIRHMPHDSATPASVAIAPRGDQAVSGGADGLIHVWDLATGAERHVFEGHEGTVTSLRYLADGRHIVSGGEDNSVRVWRLPLGQSTT